MSGIQMGQQAQPEIEHELDGVLEVLGTFPLATAKKFVKSRMRENRMSGSVRAAAHRELQAGAVHEGKVCTRLLDNVLQLVHRMFDEVLGKLMG